MTPSAAICSNAQPDDERKCSTASKYADISGLWPFNDDSGRGGSVDDTSPCWTGCMVHESGQFGKHLEQRIKFMSRWPFSLNWQYCEWKGMQMVIHFSLEGEWKRCGRHNAISFIYFIFFLFVSFVCFFFFCFCFVQRQIDLRVIVVTLRAGVCIKFVSASIFGWHIWWAKRLLSLWGMRSIFGRFIVVSIDIFNIYA